LTAYNNVTDDATVKSSLLLFRIRLHFSLGDCFEPIIVSNLNKTVYLIAFDGRQEIQIAMCDFSKIFDTVWRRS
jgi:hypothetical protein